MFVDFWKMSIYRKEANSLCSSVIHHFTLHSLDPSHTQTMHLHPITPVQPCLLSNKHSADDLITATSLKYLSDIIQGKQIISADGFRGFIPWSLALSFLGLMAQGVWQNKAACLVVAGKQTEERMTGVGGRIYHPETHPPRACFL